MRYGYDENDVVLDENVTFQVTCTMRKRWAPYFITMLRQMELFGYLGTSRSIKFLSDGDGDFRPKFQIDKDAAIPIIGEKLNSMADTFYDAG